MTETSRFFAGGTGDERYYDQADLAAVFSTIIRDGWVQEVGAGLMTVPTQPATRAVTVQSGAAWIQGYYYENTGDVVLTIDAPDASPRIDAVMLRLDSLVNREIRLRIAKGTPAATPVAPEPLRDITNGGFYELLLAKITVSPATNTITGANISTAARYQPTECGVAGAKDLRVEYLIADDSLDMNGSHIINLAEPSASDDAATKNYVDTHSSGGGSSVAPTGSLMYWGGPAGSPPTGWLLCDGRALPTASYPALFGVIGYSYGGTGANFNLPDGRSNIIGCYDSRYPEWQPVGSIHGQMAHAATSTGTQNLVQWVVVGGLIIKT